MSKKTSTDSSISGLLNALVSYVGKTNQFLETENSFLDQSLSAAKAFFERQTLGGLALISPHDYLEDALVLKDKPSEIAISIGKAQARAGMTAQITIDGKAQKPVAIGPAGKARFYFTAKQTGCFPLSIKLFSKSGAEIKDPRNQHGFLMQVFNNKPVICVDASLLKTRLVKTEKQLKHLSAAGFDLVYLDFNYKHSVDELRKIRYKHQLPQGAIISLTTRLQKIESFDVDFKQTFLAMAINRLKAKGIPVVALMSDFKPDKHYYFPDIPISKSTVSITSQQVENYLKKAEKFCKHREQNFKTGNKRIEWRLEQLVTGKWHRNNACQVEFNNQLARQDIFQAIDAAEKQIDLQFYIFKESRFTQELGMHLAHAAERGVQIRLMVDALWSGENFLGNWNSLLKRMAKTKNIHIVGADALTLSDEWDALALRQRDHRKLIVIDQQLAFIGGRNAADEYYYDWSEVPIAEWTLADAIPWLDVHAKLQGEIVESIQQLFNQTWLRNGGKKFLSKNITQKAFDKMNAQSRAKLVVHEGTHDANGLAAYEALIGGAQKKLILVNDFPVLDDIAELLIQAVKRGVKVTFLTGNVLARKSDGSFFEGGKHRELFEYVVKSRLGVLADAGVSVYEFETDQFDNIASVGGKVRPYVHAKLVTADGRYVSLGSANLDATASYWEREANVLIEDQKLVKKIDRKLLTLCKKGNLIDTQSLEWKRETTQREIVSRLWPSGF